MSNESDNKDDLEIIDNVEELFKDSKYHDELEIEKLFQLIMNISNLDRIEDNENKIFLVSGISNLAKDDLYSIQNQFADLVKSLKMYGREDISELIEEASDMFNSSELQRYDSQESSGEENIDFFVKDQSRDVFDIYSDPKNILRLIKTK